MTGRRWTVNTHTIFFVTPQARLNLNLGGERQHNSTCIMTQNLPSAFFARSLGSSNLTHSFSNPPRQDGVFNSFTETKYNNTPPQQKSDKAARWRVMLRPHRLTGADRRPVRYLVCRSPVEIEPLAGSHRTVHDSVGIDGGQPQPLFLWTNPETGGVSDVT